MVTATAERMPALNAPPSECDAWAAEQVQKHGGIPASWANAGRYPDLPKIGDWLPRPLTESERIAMRADLRHREITGHESATPAPINLPASLFDERPELARIRQAAHARTRSGDAVFGAMLARLSALTPPSIQGPAPVGEPCSLNVAVALVGASGTGKSSAAETAEVLLPLTLTNEVLTVALGSGEGLVEAYMGIEDEVDDDGKKRKVRRQVRSQVLFMVDEGQALSEMAARKGSTLLPTLRSAWSGQRLGQANASEDRTRHLPPGEYRMAALAGFQPETAVALVEDAAGGTPQRWLWLAAADPTIPDVAPEWPGRFEWSPPAHRRGPMDLAPEVAAEIRQSNLERARGEVTIDPLDGHRDLSRLKVAGLLALLAGRLDINTDDWRLAGVVLDTSDKVRGQIIAAARERAAESERVQTARVIGRNIAMASNEEQRALDAWTKAIARHVAKDGCEGGCKRRCLTRAVPGKYRDHVTIDTAIDEAAALGWIIVDGTTYRPGTSRPAPSGGTS